MKRGLYRAEAIILNSFDYSESDRILTFYTREHGKIKGIAKGARRSKKRFVNNLEPLCLIKLIYFQSEKSELVRVEDSTLIEGFQNLRADIDRLSLGCYLLELVSEMTREGQVLSPVFTLLGGFLKMLDEGGEAEALVRFFEIRLLAALGYMPYLNGCVTCKSHFDGEAALKFSSDRGGVVCRRCSAAATGLIGISAGTVRFLQTAARFDLDKLRRLKPAQTTLDECEKVMYDFIKFQIGKELKTKRFIDKMKGASFSELCPI